MVFHDFNAHYDIDNIIVDCGVTVQAGATVTLQGPLGSLEIYFFRRVANNGECCSSS